MLFTKKIIQPGTYVVDRKDGTKQRIFVGPERIGKIATTFGRMTENGLRIPAPWRHDPKAQPLRLDMDSQDVDAFQNAGFWNKVWVGDDGALYGQLDVRDPKARTKVGKTVVECSPRLDAKWVDGSGDEYEDAMTHCALVTHPVARGQDNFEPVDDAIALSLGSYLSQADITALPDEFAFHYADSVGVNSSTAIRQGDEGFDTSVQGPTGSVKTAVQALALAGIPLPDDTDETNLAEYIVVALQAFVAGKEQSDDLGGMSTTKPPRKSKEQTSVIMSKELQAIVDNQEAVTQHLSAGQPLTVEFLEGLSAEPEETVQFSVQQQAMLQKARTQLRDSYKSRIEACVHAGKISPKYAKQYGEPLLEQIDFAIGANGEEVKQPADVIIEAWEQIPPGSCLTGKSPTTVRKSQVDVFGQQTFSLEGMSDEEPPESMEEPPNEPVTGKEAEELALSIMDSVGLSH